MANLYVNNGTIWVSVKQPYVNNAGSFTPAKAVYIHNGTSWTQVFYRFETTLSSSDTVSYDLKAAALAAGWNGTSKLNATININSGSRVRGTGNNVSAAINLNGLLAESVVTINNSGTIVGSRGGYGSMQQNGYVNTSWAAGNPTSKPTGQTYIGPDGNTYGNYSNTIYYYGPGIGGSWPVYNSFSGGTGDANGGNGENGGSAIYLSSNISLIINNSSTGLIVGGGGGAGGMGGNNRGGGVGGNGGYLIEETGAHPAVIVNNTAGGILASGGGGAGGWGNRLEGEGHGGYYGASAIGFFWTGAGATQGTSPGLATNNTGTTIINTAGTFTASPAV